MQDTEGINSISYAPDFSLFGLKGQLLYFLLPSSFCCFLLFFFLFFGLFLHDQHCVLLLVFVYLTLKEHIQGSLIRNNKHFVWYKFYYK